MTNNMLNLFGEKTFCWSCFQEEPLPHELRPIPVLKMTMDYLATTIMDQVEGREGEWFDFVWNRTRGIRKVKKNSNVPYFNTTASVSSFIRQIKSYIETECASLQISSHAYSGLHLLKILPTCTFKLNFTTKKQTTVTLSFSSHVAHINLP